MTPVLFCLYLVKFLADAENALDFILKACRTFPLSSSSTQTDLTLLTAAPDEPGAAEGQWIQEEPADRSFFCVVLTKLFKPDGEAAVFKTQRQILRSGAPAANFTSRTGSSPPNQTLAEPLH